MDEITGIHGSALVITAGFTEPIATFCLHLHCIINKMAVEIQQPVRYGWRKGCHKRVHARSYFCSILLLAGQVSTGTYTNSYVPYTCCTCA